MDIEGKLGIVIGVVCVSTLIGSCFYNYGSHSRRTLNPGGKIIEYTLPSDYEKMISVSSGGSEGDVMVTYETNQGNLKTKEYNRAKLFETTIDWKPAKK